MKKAILTALILCTMFLITASSCFAQVIYGCVKSNGQLIIVTGPNQCKTNETAIQLASPTPSTGITRAVHGTVEGSTPPTITSGTGFSVTRSDVGRYEITFNTPFAGRPDCVLTGNFADELHFCGYDASSRGIFVFCVEPTITAPDTPSESIAPAFQDTSFSLICVE